MIGPSRSTTSLAESLRAPYAAPQTVANAQLLGGGNSPPPLVPYVPREFRELAHRDVTVLPAAQRSTFTGAPGPDAQQRTEAWATDEVIAHFGDVDQEAIPQPGLTVEFHVDLNATWLVEAELQNEAELEVADVVKREPNADLPWIDAYTEEGPVADETWPLGEAGKRLDELTESLSSLDASRARQDVTNSANNANLASSSEAPLPMWNEDEWIDIMPTTLPVFDQPLSRDVDQSSTADVDQSSTADVDQFSNAMDASLHVASGAEWTARALEALAQRIRVGEVQVPEARPDVAQEALLAGVLASMLGWRQ